MTEGLQRLVLDYRTGELVVRCLYRSQDGPNPGTVRRRREVTDLARTGLQDALRALEGARVDIVGTSGYTTREDVLCITEGAEGVSSVHKKLEKGA